MTIVLFLIATTALYGLLFWFAGRRTRERVGGVTEPPPAVDVEAENAEQCVWTALDDHQLDRLLKESSP